MKLIIDVDDDNYKAICADQGYSHAYLMWWIIKNGIPYEETNLVEYISLYKKKEEFYKSQGQDVTAREMGFVAELLQEIKSEQRPQGKWIVQNGEVVCDHCFEPNIETNFCPHCGAAMV